MNTNTLIIWIVANILFFATNFFLFQLLNAKLWKIINSDSVFNRNKFHFVLGASLVIAYMFYCVQTPLGKVVELFNKGQITQKVLLNYMLMTLGISTIWNITADRFSKLLFQIIAKRNELIEMTSENSYFFPARLTIYGIVVLTFSSVIVAILNKLLPQISLPNFIG